MKVNKKIIIGLIIFILLIILLLVVLIAVNRKNNYNYEATPAVEDIPDVVDENKVHRVDIRNDYYLVDSIITVFNTRCDDLYSEYNEESDIKIASEYLYNILDNRYIEKYNITLDNIYDKFQNVSTYNFLINDMYCIQNNEDIYVYFIYGTVGKITSIERENVKYIVVIDKSNDTYSILPSTELVEELGFGNVKEEQQLQNDFGNIEVKENYNIYGFKNISDQQYAEDLFNDFKNRLLYDRNNLYTLLDENYTIENFNNFEDFNEFCINNYRDFVSMTFTNYSKTKNNDEEEYICLDQDGNYYRFIEVAPMKYTVSLGK